MKRSYQKDQSDSGFQSKRKFVKKSHQENGQNPKEIRVIDFAECRASEVEALSRAVAKMSGTKTISQRLPRHMRRRAMAHDVKRLPRRLREAMQNEMKKHPKINPNKRPSRKYRRRPKNLLEDYNRRQKKCCWLETHIWHAKRFHMVEKWGYKLPFSPCDKSARACYRAASNHCLLQDVSYMCCVEVKGPEDKIVQCIKHLTSPETGPTIAAKVYLDGRRCGRTVLFSCNQYPTKPIGEVSFMWRPHPPHAKSWKGRQLWIWCHPSCFDKVMQEVEQCCRKELGKPESMGNKNDAEHSNVIQESSEKFDETSGLVNLIASFGDVTIRSLKDSLVRFQLTGPLSQAVLAETLQPSKIDVAQVTDDHKTENVLWWENYFSNDDAMKTFNDQKAAWSQLVGCQSPAEVPPCLVVGLTVRDPRVLLPQKRCTVEEIRQGVNIKPMTTYTEELASCLSDSPLWEEAVRKETKATKMAEHELNKLRAEHLVPGTTLELGRRESRIPILLVQRPGFRQTAQTGKQCKSGYGSGWDLIVPAGFGMAFHLAMVYRAARVGGQREASCVAAEVKELFFPDDFPDTPAGEAEQKSQSEELKSKYQKRPPAKRPNYVKLGIPAPFDCPWKQLVSYWASKSIENDMQEKTEAVEDTQFYVMRNKKGLRLLHTIFTSEKTRIPAKINKMELVANDVLKMVQANKFAIAPVIITMLGRGVPLKFGHICIPTEDDLKSLQQDKTWAGPKESLHPDPAKAQRKKEKDIKKKKKMMFVGKNPFHSKAVDELSVKSAISVDDPSVLKSTTNVDDGSLVIPTTNVDQSSLKANGNHLTPSLSRPVIGYVSHGDFALGQGQGAGKGFCSVVGIHQLRRAMLENKECIVLVRNTTSLQYRFASLTLISP